MPRRRRPPRAGALSELSPSRTATQIATLQLLFYACALILMLFTALVAGIPFGLDMLLGWERVRGDTTQGWMLSFVWLLDGIICMPIAIVIFIARSKLVPDFALTIHFLHLIFTTLYTHSLPRNSMWWLTIAVSSAGCISLSTWGCRYRELQSVFSFGGRRILGPGGDSTSAITTAGVAPPQESSRSSSSRDGDYDDTMGDEEMGFSRGRGRGRERNGTYEMVKIEEAAE